MSDKYGVLQELGRGTFGIVYKIKNNKDGKLYAMKRILKSKILRNTYLNQAFWKEIQIMKTLSCENSVQFIDFFQSINNYNVLMDLCNEDLYKYLKTKNSGLPIEEVKNILLQLNNVFKKMYNHKIMHRDLKLQNIMIKFKNNINGEYIVKLADYGFSKFLDNDLMAKSHLGTPITMAPEVIEKKAYTMKADLWSVGVIIYQLLFNTIPFKGNDEKGILENILSKPSFLKTTDENLNDLINKLLVIDPDYRLGWEEYFKHPFFNEKKDDNNFRYEKIKEFNNELNSNDLKIFIGKDKVDGKQFYIKQYSKSFAKKYNNEIQNEIKRAKSFINCSHAIQFKELYEKNDDDYIYLIYKYIEGISLIEFTNNNEISEDLIRRMNIGYYNNIISFMKSNINYFDIISSYNFIVNQNQELILFDFGLIKYILPKEIVEMYYATSPSEINEITMKSNILNYGMVLFKTYYKNAQIDINKGLNVDSEKSISNQFKNFLSMCIRRNKEKRYSYYNFQFDPFVYFTSNIDIPLLNIVKLEIIIKGLKFRFESILKFYDSSILKLHKDYIHEIEFIILISLKELEIIEKIFRKCGEINVQFTLDEEISFICIYNDSTYQFVTFNLNSITDIKKIFTNNETKIIKKFLDEDVKKYKELYLKLLKTINQNINVSDMNDFPQQLIDNFKKGKIQEYSYYLISMGMDNNENKLYDECINHLQISELIFEYIIFIKSFWADKVNVNNMNNFELVEKFFGSEANNIEISSYLLDEIKEKYIFISFIGGLFREFFMKQEYSESLNLEKNKDENTFDGIIQFYPNLMQLIIETKYIKENK